MRRYCNVVLILAMSVTPACGRGMPEGHLADTASTLQRAGAGSTPNEVIKTETWTLPKGETRRIEGFSLFVIASKEIIIDGDLDVFPSYSFGLFSPTITVNGHIHYVYGPGQKERDFRESVVDAIGSCTIDINQQYGIVVPPGDSLDITMNRGRTDPRCQMRSNGIYAYRGREGIFSDNPLDPPALRNGEPGGSIEIGTSKAIAYVNRIARQNGDVLPAASDGTIVLDGPVSGGNGGTGADDREGRFQKQDQTWAFVPGDGGDGGSVNIKTGALSFGAATYIGGGNGGIGGEPFISPSKLNGIPTDPNAANLFLWESSGGNGGGASLDAIRSGQVQLQPGSGGDAGLAGAQAGNGDTTARPAGSGGDVTFKLGRPGYAGKGQTVGLPPPTNGSYQSDITFTGGTGATVGATSFKEPNPGGKGGSFDLVIPEDVASFLNHFPFTIKLDSFGTGGFGESYCGTRGVRGGKGGHFTGDLKYVTLTSSFTGGDGGDGTPAGMGGAGGIDVTTGKQIGANGAEGTSC